MTARNGKAEWHGSVETGSGTITVGNGVFEGAYSYESRFGEAAGTNPQQLLAAAHAGCFTLDLASGLSAAVHPRSRFAQTRASISATMTARSRWRASSSKPTETCSASTSR